MFLVFEFVDVVESHAASLAQFPETEHPAPPKLPQLHPVYLYESLNHNQHFTYFWLTNQPVYEKIWVSQKDGPGGGGTPRSPAHKEQSYGHHQCSVRAVQDRGRLLPYPRQRA